MSVLCKKPMVTSAVKRIRRAGFA